MSEEETCALHDYVVGELAKSTLDAKREYRWVIGIAISIVVIAISWVNVESANRNDRAQETMSRHMGIAQETMKVHVDSANKTFKSLETLLGKLVHSHTEVAMNQRTVMKQLKLEFEEIPHYEP